MPLTSDVPVRRRTSRRAVAMAERREQILDAAVAAFTDKGFNGTSMRDVAVRVGMSHTGLLHHFPDKVGLLEAVLDRRVARGSGSLRLDPSHGEEFLCDLIALAVRDQADPADLRMFRIIAAESLSPGHPAHGYMERWYREVRGSITQALEDLRSRGHYIAAIPVSDAAAQIAGLRDGLDPQWLLDPASIDVVACMMSQLRLYTDLDLAPTAPSTSTPTTPPTAGG